MIKIRHHGKNFQKTISFLNKAKNGDYLNHLDRLGEKGVQALSEATPSDTGETASSWSYNIRKEPGRVIISWSNDVMADNVPVVILLQYGHATQSGAYVEGTDFINPAMKEIFESIAEEAWREVTR